VCLANCAVCASGYDFSHVLDNESDTEGVQQVVGMQAPTWKTCHAKFHSIGAAVMSCRNEKAPEGVAAHAHLADGLLHLILIRECSRPDYLRFVSSAILIVVVERLRGQTVSGSV
jgi:ceramide kinase